MSGVVDGGNPTGAETHILSGHPKAEVTVWSDGSVDVTLDGVTLLSVERLGEIVAFVETHGQVTVNPRG